MLTDAEAGKLVRVILHNLDSLRELLNVKRWQIPVLGTPNDEVPVPPRRGNRGRLLVGYYVRRD